MHPGNWNSTTMLINYIQAYVIHLTQLIPRNLHTNRSLLSPVYVCMYNYVYNTSITRETRFNRHVRKLHITSAPCLIPARKIAIMYYYAIMLLNLRGLQCNWNIRGAPHFTLYFIPQEYTVSFVVLDFTVTLRQFRMA